jgi:CheY-like chemotaxis protein
MPAHIAWRPACAGPRVAPNRAEARRDPGPFLADAGEPEAPAAGDRGGPEQAAAAGGRPRVKILVVDDNVDSAQSLCWLLEAGGFDARAAFDGPAALEKAASFRPEIVLLDLGLPRLDGFEVAARLRADPSTRPAVLIALSGYSRDEDRNRSRAVGFDHHLVKPVEFDELLALLHRHRPA